MSAVADPREAVGTELLAALARRDFAAVARSLASGLRLRALLPSGLLELEGADAAAGRLEAWFGGGGELRVLRSAADFVGDRLHVTYRLRFGDHPMRPGSGPHVIEQHLFCTLEDGRIAAADLLCSGFRPA